MDTFEAAEPDRFHQSLSSAWAGFLSAQHCTHEVNALRKALDEHVQQTSRSITACQSEASIRYDLLAADVAASNSKIQQCDARLEVASQDREDASAKVTELTNKVAAQEKGLDGVRSLASENMKTIQEQYRVALEKIEFLREELSEAHAEKLASEQKLAVLESRIAELAETRHGVSGGRARFLDEMFSRREELLGLLDTRFPDASSTTLAPPFQVLTIPGGSTSRFQERPMTPTKGLRRYHSREDSSPAAAKRKPEEPLESQPKRPSPFDDPGEEIRSLYLVFRDRYKTDPPKSDTAFIREFINSIESPAMSKHIQESLMAMLPKHVGDRRDTRPKSPRRHVRISRELTWRMFREALARIPGPS